MLVSEIVGKDKRSLTKKEIDYLTNAEIKEAYYYRKDGNFYTFCVFTDGSVTKTDAETDEEVGSSVEEMEQLKTEGYEIEDVTDEYTFE